MTGNDEIKLSKEDIEKLAKAGIDLSKQPFYSKEPIFKPSSCDVYRNNKKFLSNMQLLYKYGSTKWTIPEKFWAETLEDAEKKFEDMNWNLPSNWYRKLRNKFDSFKDVFNT